MVPVDHPKQLCFHILRQQVPILDVQAPKQTFRIKKTSLSDQTVGAGGTECFSPQSMIASKQHPVVAMCYRNNLGLIKSPILYELI